MGRAAGEQAVSETRGSGAKRYQTQPPTLAQPQSPADRWTTAILIFAIVGTPLAILPASFELYDTTPKLAVAYLSAALLLWFPGWCGVAALRRNRYGSAFYGLLILGMASLVISATTSSDASLSFAGTVWRRLGVGSQAIVFFIAGVIAAYVSLYRQAAKTLMLGMETAAGVASFYAILQYSGLDPLIPRSFLYIRLVSRGAPTRDTYSGDILCNLPASRYFDRRRFPLERDTSAVEADARTDPAALA